MERDGGTGACEEEEEEEEEEKKEEVEEVEEGEEGGVTFTRIVGLEIDKGDRVKFSQRAPLIVINKPFFADGGMEQTRLVKKGAEEERCKEEAEEEAKEEEEEEKTKEEREDLLCERNSLLQQMSNGEKEGADLNEGGFAKEGGGGRREEVEVEEVEEPSLASKIRTSPFLDREDKEEDEGEGEGEEEEESEGEKEGSWLDAGHRLRCLPEEPDYELVHNNLEEGGGREGGEEGGEEGGGGGGKRR